MRVLLAFDKFKDSMTANAACTAAADGVRSAAPDAATESIPLADGGDGFLQATAALLDGEVLPTRARDPLLRGMDAAIGRVELARIGAPGPASFGMPPEGMLAVVEMAVASGLTRLETDERDPLRTSSAGTGDLLAAAAALRPAAIVVGVGGSATNDLGVGALEALGLRAFDAAGKPLVNAVPNDWPHIARFAWTRPDLPPVFIACDVGNPLLGENGATSTFGPQKGLKREHVGALDREAARVARLLCEATGAGIAIADEPGSGAAGGIAFGLRVALGARIISGFDFFAACAGLDSAIGRADVVVTGEGRFDATSLLGKGPGEIVRRALAAQKRLVVACGAIDGASRGHLEERGARAVALVDVAPSEEAAMCDGERLLARVVRDALAGHRVVKVLSPAKINLHLDILRRRDDGFHDLATIFQAVDLEDELAIELPGGDADELVVEGAPGLAADATNLVLRAAVTLRAEFGATRVPPLRMRLLKRIPVQAGLGGGSSNAAAALAGINAMLRLGLDEAGLENRAAALGSDCAFFVRGGTAIGSGRGEVLRSTPRVRDFAVLLVVPECTVPTGKAFGMLAPESLGARTDHGALGAWLAGSREEMPALHNTFEEPVRRAWPAIDETLRTLADAEPLAVLLSGSGAGCFALFENREEAERAVRDLRLPARLVRMCMPLPRGVKVLE